MTEPHFDAVLSCAFTPDERLFLEANEEFKATLSRVSDDNVERLLQLGVQLLLSRGNVSPSAPAPGIRAVS